MAVTIRIIKGEGEEKPRDLVLEKGTVLIGRGDDRDVRLSNDSVSRRHCVIEKQDDRWTIQDESTSNGTLVNGQKTSGRRVLKHGDVLEIGEVVLRVGLDRPLRDDSKPLLALSMKATVNLIAACVGVATLVGALFVGWLLYSAKQAVAKLVDPITPEMTTNKSVPAFSGADRVKVSFATIGELAGIPPSPITINRTFTEWDLYDVWSSGVEGQEPRLFDGLDLDLIGGESIVLSGYFFTRETYLVPDATDPYAVLYFEMEGWSGFGQRFGAKDLPAIRYGELPRFVRAMALYPENILAGTVVGYKGEEIGSFTSRRLFDPDKGHPLGSSKMQQMLEPFVGKPEPANIPMEGRCYSFHYRGARYAASVRGSSRLLQRFGGIDKVANAFFDTIVIDEDPQESGKVDVGALTTQLADEVEKLKVFAHKDKLIAGQGAINYEDLMRARGLLLQAQRQSEPPSGEDELRSLYFEVRNRTQSELEFCASKAYEGRGRSRSDEGGKGLQAIRNFMADYPPLTMSRSDPGYPEWTMFVEDASLRKPYDGS